MSYVWQGAAWRLPVLPVLRGLPGCGRRGCGGAQDRLRPVLRPGRLHRRLRVGGPEDVRAELIPYQELLKGTIEAFGGTVEKFAGDAIMAVFGAPVSHEDDAERAVRAALRILDSLTSNAPASTPGRCRSGSA